MQPPEKARPLSPARRLLYLAILIVTPVLGFLLLAELGIRLFFKDDVDTDRLRARLKSNSIAAFVKRSDDPVLGYELIPNRVCDFRDSVVAISPEGFRTSPGSAGASPRQDATIRVAVLGDSTSFGWGVGYEATFPEIFRKKIEAACKQQVEVRNYSVPGYNSEQESRLLTERVLKAYAPDLVIVCYDHNDAEPALTAFQGALLPEYGDNPLHSMLLKYIIRKTQERETYYHAFDTSKHEFVKNTFGYYIVGGPLYDRHLEALRQLAAEAKRRKIPVIAIIQNPFVIADLNFEANPDYARLTQRIDTNLQAMGYQALDLYRPYQEQMKREGWADLTGFWLLPRDPHPNPAAHEFIANQLVRFVLATPDLAKLFLNHKERKEHKERGTADLR